MAKPRAVKVGSVLRLTDLLHADKVASGDKVAFLLPIKKSRTKKGSWKFVRGTLYAKWVVYCECCGPEFYAFIEKADGTKVHLYDSWRRQNSILSYT